MILLSFTSAAKYILSLMLAMLGIIPFEEVQPLSSEPVAAIRSVNPNENSPLDHMPVKTDFGTAFFNPGELHPEYTERIKMRDNCDLTIQDPVKKLVYTVDYNSFSGEIKSDPKHQHFHIICCSDSIKSRREKLVIIQSGK